MLVREQNHLKKPRPWPYKQNWSICNIFHKAVEIQLQPVEETEGGSTTAGTWSNFRGQGCDSVLEISSYFPFHTFTKSTRKIFSREQVLSQLLPSALYLFKTCKPCKRLWFYGGLWLVCGVLFVCWCFVVLVCFFNSYLGALITQRAVEEGKNDLENPLVVIKLIAMFITQPFFKKSENPLTFCFVLESMRKIASDISK